MCFVCVYGVHARSSFLLAALPKRAYDVAGVTWRHIGIKRSESPYPEQVDSSKGNDPALTTEPSPTVCPNRSPASPLSSNGDQKSLLR